MHVAVDACVAVLGRVSMLCECASASASVCVRVSVSVLERAELRLLRLPVLTCHNTTLTLVCAATTRSTIRRG